MPHYRTFSFSWNNPSHRTDNDDMRPTRYGPHEGGNRHVGGDDATVGGDIPLSRVRMQGSRLVHVMDDVLYVARDVIQMRKAHPRLPDDAHD